MSKFAVGDRVLITATHIPNTSYPVPGGSNGKIIEIANDEDLHNLVSCEIYPGNKWWFADGQLVLMDSNSMPELEMGLDEIHLAQEIMEGLR